MMSSMDLSRWARRRTTDLAKAPQQLLKVTEMHEAAHAVARLVFGGPKIRHVEVTDDMTGMGGVVGMEMRWDPELLDIYELVRGKPWEATAKELAGLTYSTFWQAALPNTALKVALGLLSARRVARPRTTIPFASTPKVKS
jgi:hypothetical protein